MLKQGTWTGNRKWDAKTMLRFVMEASSLASSRKDNNPQWPIPVTNLVSIYRDEMAKLKMVSSLAMMNSGTDTADPDEGDFD